MKKNWLKNDVKKSKEKPQEKIPTIEDPKTELILNILKDLSKLKIGNYSWRLGIVIGELTL